MATGYKYKYINMYIFACGTYTVCDYALYTKVRKLHHYEGLGHLISMEHN